MRVTGPLHGLRAGEGKEARLGQWGGFQPMANRKMKKAFYFPNLF
jgi:hypothetical protein